MSNVSGLMCTCGTALSFDQEQYMMSSTRHVITCSMCRRVITAADVVDLDLRILDEYSHLTDSQVALENTWFHATTSEHWLDQVQEAPRVPVVHLGTKESSLERARHLRIYGVQEVYLYSVVLDKGKMNDTIHEDNDKKFPTYIDEMSRFRYTDFNRYINRFENAGHISLIADPNLLTITERVSI